jgi:hypothetical protein
MAGHPACCCAGVSEETAAASPSAVGTRVCHQAGRALVHHAEQTHAPQLCHLVGGRTCASGPRVQSTSRVLAIVDGRRVRLQSRQQRPLARYFPEIVEALREWFVGEVVLDGVIWGLDRRVQEVVDSALDVTRSSSWTDYLRPVYDARRTSGSRFVRCCQGVGRVVGGGPAGEEPECVVVRRSCFGAEGDQGLAGVGG